MTTNAQTAVPVTALGRSGVHVSRVALGTMNFGGPTDEATSISIVQQAFDAGINFIDTADVYEQGRSEQIVGRAIKGIREEIVLATKFHFQRGEGPLRRGNSRRWIFQAVEESLRRLDTDRIDLYQAHRPDPHTDLEETLAALDDLVRQGKILYYGTSTFGAEDLVEAQLRSRQRGRHAPLTEQIPYSALIRHYERTTLPIARRYGLGVLTFGPLAAGWLSGQYRKDAPQPISSRAARAWEGRYDLAAAQNRDKLAAADALAALAAESGIGLPELAVAFALNHPAVTSIIAGPRIPKHLDAYLNGAAITLGTDILDRIDEIVAPGTTFIERDNGRIPEALTPAALRRTAPATTPKGNPQ